MISWTVTFRVGLRNAHVFVGWCVCGGFWIVWLCFRVLVGFLGYGFGGWLCGFGAVFLSVCVFLGCCVSYGVGIIYVFVGWAGFGAF